MIEFNAHITKGNKVQLPQWLIESANLKEGDVLRLAVLHKVIVEMKEQHEKKPSPKAKTKTEPKTPKE
ncbi:MAG: hypothetical protein Q6361_04685 [Candidatus Hermodarchaeota archaeon]|nr:hypothetical protein [Candidatus Hermodarchaeota archaeon]